MLRQLRLCSHGRPTPPPVQQVSPACAAASCRPQLADRIFKGTQCTTPISLGRQGRAASTVVCAKRGRAEPEPEPEPELFEEDQFDDYEEGEAGEFEEVLRADPMTGRLMGLDPGDEAEEYEEYEEAEDEGALDEAAEAGLCRQTTAAALLMVLTGRQTDKCTTLCPLGSIMPCMCRS